MNVIRLSVITFALAALSVFAGGVGDGAVRTQAAILPEPQKIAWGEGVFDAGTGSVSRATVTRFEDALAAIGSGDSASRSLKP